MGTLMRASSKSIASLPVTCSAQPLVLTLLHLLARAQHAPGIDGEYSLIT